MSAALSALDELAGADGDALQPCFAVLNTRDLLRRRDAALRRDLPRPARPDGSPGATSGPAPPPAALLFVLGKSAIGLYLGNTRVASVYGAASSLVVMLVWVYYSSQILFLGAELTQVLGAARAAP